MTSNELGRIIVVLGMHRSGTSAITRSLQLLGVGLGENLHPAAIDNPKGFWEDRECIDINERLLRHLNSAYDRLDLGWRTIGGDENVIEALKKEAKALIHKRLAATGGLWGFKDPRTCRLLAFWQDTVLAAGCNASYVIVLRNPASVAASLEARDKIPSEKTYFLWLQHVLPSILATCRTRRIIVDYDEFLDSPYTQLGRMASALGLQLPARKNHLIEDFERGFLDGSLRHSRFTENFLQLDRRAPMMVGETYKLLIRVARDQESLDSSSILEPIKHLSERLEGYSSAFAYINALEDRLGHFSKPTADPEAAKLELVTLSASHAWLISERKAWEKTASELEQSITALQGQMQEVLAGSAWLALQRDAWAQVAVQREQSITALQGQMQEVLAGSAWLTLQRDAWAQVAVQREQSITALQGQMQEVLAGSAWLTSQRDAWAQVVVQREQSITALQGQMQEVLGGSAWLTSQRDAWAQVVVQREQSITALQGQMQEVLGGSAWLTSQRDAWAQVVVQREQSITALQAQVQAMLANIAWITSQRDAWARISEDQERSIAAIAARHQKVTQTLAERDASLSRIRNHWGMRLVNFLSFKKVFSDREQQ